MDGKPWRKAAVWLPLQVPFSGVTALLMEVGWGWGLLFKCLRVVLLQLR
jgi:hypothetical protein